jgi:hypothetical protein
MPRRSYGPNASREQDLGQESGRHHRQRLRTRAPARPNAQMSCFAVMGAGAVPGVEWEPSESDDWTMDWEGRLGFAPRVTMVLNENRATHD